MAWQLAPAEILGKLYVAYQTVGMEKPSNRNPVSQQHIISWCSSFCRRRGYSRIRRHISGPMNYQAKKL